MGNDEFCRFLVTRQKKFLARALYDERLFAFIEKNDFLKKIAYHYAFIWLVSEFSKSIEKQISEREDRIQIMRQRLQVINGFNEALDPIATKGKPIQITEFAIFEENEHGTHRATGDYLAESVLEEFWKIARERIALGDKYVPYNSTLQLSLLSEFFSRIGHQLSEVKDAQTYKNNDVKSLFGCTSGRLPISNGEIEVLKSLVRKIENK